MAFPREESEQRHVDDLPLYLSGRSEPGVRSVCVESRDAPTSTVVIDRTPDPLPAWIGPDRRPLQLGTDFTVRRVMWTPFLSACAAFGDVGPDVRARPSTHLGRRITAPRPLARLTLQPALGQATDDMLWLPASMHRRPAGHALPVHVVLEAWSTGRTELRIQVRGDRHRIRVPRGYFDVAHALIDRIRFEIEVRVGERAA